jgi:hypothetical protein
MEKNENLDYVFWILDSGFWILDSGSTMNISGLIPIWIRVVEPKQEPEP